MRSFIIKNEEKILRYLEILPGFVSWNLILFPYWGIIFIPKIVAYFILIFNIYWFYQSLQLAISAFISHIRIQAAKIYNWMEDVNDFPDWNKIIHVVIIPIYKEPIHILERTLTSLANQKFPAKKIVVVLAMEAREPAKERRKREKILNHKFKNIFGELFTTTHEIAIGEVPGKASNERFAAIWIKKEYIDKKGIDINYVTVTSCDSDHKFHPQHFAYLTYKFLDNPERYKRFWQPAVMFYNNIWEIPAITRVPNTLMSIWNLSLLPRKDRLINAQNYSLSFKLLSEVDYWDPDKIPEDWGIFFKAFYKKQGKIEVEPIYLPLLADAAQSTSFWKTLQNQYEQIKRWAWGASDDPWIIRDYFLVPKVPFWEKTMRLIFVLWSHFLWPVNWFLITLGITVPTLFNPEFSRTALGYMVPRLSSFILTISLAFLIITIIIDNFYKPPRPNNSSLWKLILSPFEFILMPIAGFFFSALPGLDAHTRLMLGKYIQYKVTEKV